MTELIDNELRFRPGGLAHPLPGSSGPGKRIRNPERPEGRHNLRIHSGLPGESDLHSSSCSPSGNSRSLSNASIPVCIQSHSPPIEHRPGGILTGGMQIFRPPITNGKIRTNTSHRMQSMSLAISSHYNRCSNARRLLHREVTSNRQ